MFYNFLSVLTFKVANPGPGTLAIGRVRVIDADLDSSRSSTDNIFRKLLPSEERVQTLQGGNTMVEAERTKVEGFGTPSHPKGEKESERIRTFEQNALDQQESNSAERRRLKTPSNGHLEGEKNSFKLPNFLVSSPSSQYTPVTSPSKLSVFSLLSLPELPILLQPKMEVECKICFTPPASGEFTAFLEILPSDPHSR